ncbi:hypothetical protein ACFUT3_30360 [Streptomyces cinereoruber]|uniref:hypothetical protein n=1 Tax=Streptomyces cinereoruber TaxID=67260 RepID=UPI003640F468
MKVFRVGGTTDQITECELCGKPELKGTVQMIELDADGNDFQDHYFGTSCAAKAAGWTQRDVKAGVKAAEAAKREAARIAREEESRRFCQARDAYFLAKYGERCHFTVARKLGRKSFELLIEFEGQYAV